MVLDLIMKEINSFCRKDDTCVLVILVLIGFLLCMFFQREGFSLEDISSDLNQVEKENQNVGEMGKPPTDLIGKEVYKNVPTNGYLGLENKIQIARSGKQFNSKYFNQSGKIDISKVGLPVAYDWERTGGYYSFQDKPSDFGLGKPLKPSDMVKSIPTGEKQDSVPVGITGGGVDDPNDVDKETKLVLFYAPWCGHSRNMLKDYDNVISQYNGKMMNGHKLEIIKIDMDKNPKASEEYGVEVKGFPTLHLFQKVNGKESSQVFIHRQEDKIIEELKNKTKI